MTKINIVGRNNYFNGLSTSLWSYVGWVSSGLAPTHLREGFVWGTSKMATGPCWNLMLANRVCKGQVVSAISTPSSQYVRRK